MRLPASVSTSRPRFVRGLVQGLLRAWVGVLVRAGVPAIGLTAFLNTAHADPRDTRSSAPFQDDARVQSGASAWAGLATPLTDQKGDPDRGQRIVTSRQSGMCLLCHRGPFEPVAHQGNLAGSLAGAGQRWSAAQLRLRIVNARRLDPNSLMPAFHDTGEQRQTAPEHAGRPLLSAQEVEDVVAFLMTLKD